VCVCVAMATTLVGSKSRSLSFGSFGSSPSPSSSSSRRGSKRKSKSNGNTSGVSGKLDLEECRHLSLAELSARLEEAEAAGERLRRNLSGMCAVYEKHAVKSNKVTIFEARLKEGVEALTCSTSASLEVVRHGSEKLSSRISRTKKLATKVTGRVRELNKRRTRAAQALERVQGILGLKGCVVGVQTSMRNGDLRGAAEYIYRYRRAEASGNTVVSAAQGEGVSGDDGALMSRTEEELRDAVLTKLEDAVRRTDPDAEAAVLEYCGLFGLLGIGREGVSRYGQFLCKMVGGRYEDELVLAGIDVGRVGNGYVAPSSVNFIDLLSKLFNESAAAMQRAEAHIISMPGFEREFAAPALIAALHRQCDQDSSKTLTMYIASRRLAARSAIAFDDDDEERVRKVITADPTAPFAEDPLSALDTLLDEIAMVGQHTESYDRFVRSGHEAALASARAAMGNGGDAETKTATIAGACEYNRVIQELAGFYTILEGAFIRESIAKAFGIEDVCPVAASTFLGDSSHDQEYAEVGLSSDAVVYVSTSVEDNFWIMQKCLSRAMATGHVDSVCGVLNNAVTSLQQQLVVLLQNRVAKMKSDVQTLTQQGQLHLERLKGIVKSRGAKSPSTVSPLRPSTPDGDRGAEIAIDSVACTLNSLALASMYAQNLHSQLARDAADALDPSDSDRAKLLGCAEGLRLVARNFDESLEEALTKACGTLKSKIKAFLDGTVGAASCSYDIDEEDFARAEAHNAFMLGLADLMETVVAPLAKGLSRGNSAKLHYRVSVYLARSFERAVVRKAFSQLGALKLDKEVRAMAVYFSGRAGANVRKAVLARLVEISTLLSVDSVQDVHDVWAPTPRKGASPSTNRHGLKNKEVRRVLALRSDFSSAEIQKLRL